MAVGVGLLWPGVGFVLRSDHISNSSPAPGPAQGESEGGRHCTSERKVLHSSGQARLIKF